MRNRTEDGAEDRARMRFPVAGFPQPPAARPLPRRSGPCRECPAVKAHATQVVSRFPAAMWRFLRATIQAPDGGSAGPDAPLFGCHDGMPGAAGAGLDGVCAGWLAAFGHRSLKVRLAELQGRVPASALAPAAGWPELWEDWDAMAAACTLRPGDSLKHLPPALRQITRWEWAGVAPEDLDRVVAELMAAPRAPSRSCAPTSRETTAE
ncbi:DUF6283 family protein [Actinomadura violacea]|uniref:Uncharacterized protein n=1 Tax=Actinomadura violacea TaxID=2819934 RepID=A0ABS3RYC6_9ACTN|nr:DUF6283 family protein [Actinomadura violacea]MBO2461463.1 hypothetical protein [Actinomadura violacea]